MSILSIPSACPVLKRYHWFSKSGSFGNIVFWLNQLRSRSSLNVESDVYTDPKLSINKSYFPSSSDLKRYSSSKSGASLNPIISSSLYEP